MFVLYESHTGFCIFKVLNKSKLEKIDVFEAFSSPESASKHVKLVNFEGFKSSAEAVKAMNSLNKHELGEQLKDFLKKSIGKDNKDKLAIVDSMLGSKIKKELKIKVIHNELIDKLSKGIRSQFDSLMTGISSSDSQQLRVGLAHAFSRHSVKFNTSKLDSMIVQSIGLLDELTKELNTYCMRLVEWYGSHFPELKRCIESHITYAKVIELIGFRTSVKTTDLSDLLNETEEAQVKKLAEKSNGTMISEGDLASIQSLCKQIIGLDDYRNSLVVYITNRTKSLAPSTSVMVGEIVAAKLLAHAGSLQKLAKQPASTVQIYGAEKALFRAIKLKHNKPKYGIIYNAALVSGVTPKLQGKMARVLAGKTALCIRSDAYAKKADEKLGLELKEKVHQRLQQLEGGSKGKLNGKSKGKKDQKYKKAENGKKYNAKSDMVMEDSDEEPKKKRGKKRQREETPAIDSDSEDEVAPPRKKKKEKKEKKKKVKKEKKKKKKKKKKSSSEESSD